MQYSDICIDWGVDGDITVSTPMLYSQETLPIASQAELDQMAVEDSLITLREEIIAKKRGFPKPTI